MSSSFRHFEDELKGTACDLSGSSYRMPCPYFIQPELLESIKNARNKTINAQCFYLFGRIKHNEKEIQAKMKMCTGADVSLAQYFNRKLNTDNVCQWG